MYPPMIGSITLFPYDFAPQDWKFCDGRVLSLFDSEGLFSLLGSTFGGNAEQGTFGLPDLRSFAPPECHYCISLSGHYRNEAYEGVLGETMISAIPDNPGNLVECAGQSLPTAQYRLLQTYIGTRFGGGDANNFKLPDLRRKAPAKCRYLMAVQGNDPNGPLRDPFLGEIMLLPFDLIAPQTPWRLCNGEMLPVKQNTALRSVLGNKFGGDGRETFALPDLRASAPPKFNYYISTKGRLPTRG